MNDISMGTITSALADRITSKAISINWKMTEIKETKFDRDKCAYR